MPVPNAYGESILVTGAAGFVGSHIVRAAREAGHRVTALDVVSPQWSSFFNRDIGFWKGDIGDRALVKRIFAEDRISAVVHCAGLICVGESTTAPDRYFDQNVARFLALLDEARCRPGCAVVLSSSAAVYGAANHGGALTEFAYTEPSSPYGATKLCAELALSSYAAAFGVPWAALRYFNAAGAHPSGELAERHDPETHLIPLAIDAAIGDGAPLSVLGCDYPTSDGTAVRDYVHVWDLARAHLLALEALRRGQQVGACNLGAGRGHSVADVIREISRATGRHVPYKLAPRRLGDPAHLVADISRAHDVLGWAPECSDLPTIIADAVRARARYRTATRSAG
jgi:UDP-glucose-4-epimerase GalE